MDPTDKEESILKSIAVTRYADDDFQVSKVGNTPDGIIISEIGAGITMKISAIGGFNQGRVQNISDVTRLVSMVGNQNRYFGMEGMVGKVGDDM